MGWSGSLAPQPLALTPRFVNNEYVTAEITYSTAHVHHEVLGPGLLCAVRLYERHHESPGCGCTGVTLEQHHGYVMGGYILTAAPAAASSGREAVLWLPCQPEEFLRLLKSSNIVTHILPTLGSASSADSVNSKTTGVTNRISSTPMKIHLLTQLSFHHGLTEVVNLVASGLEIWYRM